MIYCLFMYQKSVGNLREVLLRELKLLPTFSCKDTLAVIDDRGEFELKLVDDSSEPLKSFVETFKNERALGEYFKACFTAMYQDANISEENKQILLNGMTNIIAGNISVKEIIQIYNKISPVYHIIPCYLLSDLVVCIYRGDYNFWGDDDVF